MSGQRFFSWQTVDGEPSVYSGYRIIPRSQALQLRLPLGGFVWNRPVAVLVQKDDAEETIPIVDATRVTQIAIYFIAGLLTFVLMRATRLKSG